ncbi:MAG: polymer-forming cytoskeletal protein [Pseudomonadales bacterium]|jgi:cytoskeletal protein CcmA (bactofilin family)|tara:strand:- start:477 stop:965 length:489 start_codon:yes stop_codon:yes gene_type:complete
MDLLKRVGLDREESVSLIAENCHVQGELRFSAELIINGRVSGIVTAEALGSGLTVGAKGEVIGNLFAPSIVISGQVKGDIYAFGHIELTNTARVSGNLYYQSLQMAAGSCLSGSLRQMEASEIKALMVSEENINRRTAIGRLQAVSEQELKRLSENNSASST